MNLVDRKLIAASPEAFIRYKMQSAPALKILLLSVQLEGRHLQGQCLRILAYGISELPWLPSMTTQEAEVLIRDERGRTAFIKDAVGRMSGRAELGGVRRLVATVWRGYGYEREATEAALYYLTCLSWLWLLEADLILRSAPELPVEEVEIDLEDVA
jgi:hypothetical protein